MNRPSGSREDPEGRVTRARATQSTGRMRPKAPACSVAPATK